MNDFKFIYHDVEYTIRPQIVSSSNFNKFSVEFKIEGRVISMKDIVSGLDILDMGI